MIFIAYAVGLLILAGLPALMVSRNLPLFHTAAWPASEASTSEAISVLIPARNEEAGIAASVNAVLANSHPHFEIIVLDDNSTDRTGAIVSEIARGDARVKLATSQELPAGWNGKQFACWQLAQLANFDRLLFLDADVRLSPDALVRINAEFEQAQVALLSGFPRQITASLSERMLIPMMHFVLLGYLPLDQMRGSTKPEFGAGCGQMFLADRAAYFACGGHETIRASRHDGLQLPRSFRRSGYATDLFDASDIAQVRMYDGLRAVLRGLLKNASEGIASRKLIGLFSVLLLGAAVLPIFSFAHAIYYNWPAADFGRMVATILLAIATVLSFAPPIMLARRLQQSPVTVVLHPVSVACFVALQWYAFYRELTGADPVPWKGRS